MMPFPAGIYRHYKGRRYLVLGMASDSNAEDLAIWDPNFGGEFLPLEERLVVVYVSLEAEGRKPGPTMHVRTVEDFSCYVCDDKRCANYGKRLANPADFGDHNAVRRFEYEGIDWHD